MKNQNREDKERIKAMHDVIFSGAFSNRRKNELPGQFVQRFPTETREKLSKLTAKDISQVPQWMELYKNNGSKK
jgi:hypothetical protein